VPVTGAVAEIDTMAADLPIRRPIGSPGVEMGDSCRWRPLFQGGLTSCGDGRRQSCQMRIIVDQRIPATHRTAWQAPAVGVQRKIASPVHHLKEVLHFVVELLIATVRG
jgi:hypothetical protein